MTKARDIRSYLTVLILVCVVMVALPVEAQDGIDHGETGTLNHDYFDAMGRPGSQDHWRVGDGEKYHLYPALADMRLGNYKKAWSDLDFLLKRFVNHPDALQAIQTLAGLIKQPLAGMPYFEDALAIYPQYGLTHAQYGRYLSKVGRYDAAVAELKRAIELEPSLAVAHAWLAEAYAKVGEADLARRAAERAKQLGYDGKG